MKERRGAFGSQSIPMLRLETTIPTSCSKKPRQSHLWLPVDIDATSQPVININSDEQAHHRCAPYNEVVCQTLARVFKIKGKVLDDVEEQG